jgi:hypothetical protein
MNTADFLDTLRNHPELELVFSAAGRAIAAGYHLTEVKRVSFETMDCGGAQHRWSESQFELWHVPLSGVLGDRGWMAAGKFLKIVQRVEGELPLDPLAEARVHAELEGRAALYRVASMRTEEGILRVELVVDRTRCKSAERWIAGMAGGCCGSGEVAASSGGAAAVCCA